MTRGAAKRVGVPVDVSCEDPPPPNPLCLLGVASLFTVQLWLLCSRTRPWGHHRRRIRLHSRPLTPSPHPPIVKWCPARWVCASIPLCLLLLTPTPTPHGLYLTLGMMHACESVCVCVCLCVYLLCSGLGRAASHCVVRRTNKILWISSYLWKWEGTRESSNWALCCSNADSARLTVSQLEWGGNIWLSTVLQ